MNIIKNVFDNIKIIVVGILACIIVGIIAGAAWYSYEYFVYRYVILGEYNSIYDKKHGIELIDDGQSLEKVGNNYYAYKHGWYISFNEEDDTIYLYLEGGDKNSRKVRLLSDIYNVRLIESELMMPKDFKYYYYYLKDRRHRYRSQGIF